MGNAQNFTLFCKYSIEILQKTNQFPAIFSTIVRNPCSHWLPLFVSTSFLCINAFYWYWYCVYNISYTFWFTEDCDGIVCVWPCACVCAYMYMVVYDIPDENNNITIDCGQTACTQSQLALSISLVNVTHVNDKVHASWAQ